MLDDLRAALATLESVVRELEPNVLDGAGAVRVVELFAKGEHLCAAGKALATRRAASTRRARSAARDTAARESSSRR